MLNDELYLEKEVEIKSKEAANNKDYKEYYKLALERDIKTVIDETIDFIIQSNSLKELKEILKYFDESNIITIQNQKEQDSDENLLLKVIELVYKPIPYDALDEIFSDNLLNLRKIECIIIIFKMYLFYCDEGILETKYPSIDKDDFILHWFPCIRTQECGIKVLKILLNNYEYDTAYIFMLMFAINYEKQIFNEYDKELYCISELMIYSFFPKLVFNNDKELNQDVEKLNKILEEYIEKYKSEAKEYYKNTLNSKNTLPNYHLTDKSQLILHQAKKMFKYYDENLLYDYSPISLQFCRVLEIEIKDKIILKAWNKLSEKDQLIAFDYLKENNIIKKKINFEHFKIEKIELGNIRTIFRKLKEHHVKKIKSNMFFKELASVFGSLAYLDNLITVLEQKNLDKFRNPPAHTGLLSRTDALACMIYIEESLWDMQCMISENQNKDDQTPQEILTYGCRDLNKIYERIKEGYYDNQYYLF